MIDVALHFSDVYFGPPELLHCIAQWVVEGFLQFRNHEAKSCEL